MSVSTKTLKQLKNYENKWVALSRPDEEIVGSGNNAVEAIADAKRKGYSDTILYKIFPLDKYYIPLL